MSKSSVVYLKDYKPYEASIKSVDMLFNIQEDHVVVTTTVDYENAEKSFFFDGEDLELKSLSLNDKILEKNHYELTESGLRFLDMPPEGKLTSIVHINPWENKQFSGLYSSESMLLTQCEAQGFRRITFFPDRPDVLSVYHVTIEAEESKFKVLLSNGQASSYEKAGEKRVQRKFYDPHPKPSYLFALVVGNLSAVHQSYQYPNSSDPKKNHFDLWLHTEKHNLDKTEFALQALQKAMDWDERVYQLQYDLPDYHIVATDHFNMGAMENKGLNIFNSKYVLGSHKSVTDQDYKNIMAIVAHEYFHNWTGNRVTLRDWFQLSLKEGLTVFREQQFMEDLVGVAQSRIEDLRRLQSLQFTEDSSALSHPVRPTQYQAIDNFYTATVYEKGAEVIRVLKQLVGESVYYEAVRHYLETYDGQAATIENWIEVFEQKSGQSLEQFMSWYNEAGLMVLHVHDLGQRVEVQQDHKSEKDFLLPLRTQWYTPSEGFGPVEKHWLKTKTMSFEKPSEKSILLINHEFACPCLVKQELRTEQLNEILLKSEDILLTWQLMQKKWIQLIDENKGEISAQDKEFFNNLVHRRQNDPSLLAALLSIPSYEYVLTLISIEPAVYLQRVKQLRFEIAHGILNLIKAILAEKIPHDLSSDSLAKRQLICELLSYFAQTNKGVEFLSEMMELDSMTLKVASLEALRTVDKSPQANQALDKYFELFKDQPLALLPYFKVCAQYGDEKAYDKVCEVISHEVFDTTSPNHLYALLGSLFGQNPLFVEKHPECFEFWGKWIEKLNTQNPQVAARLIGAFKSSARWPEKTKQVLKNQIDKLLTLKLHKQVFEMLTRIYKEL